VSGAQDVAGPAAQERRAELEHRLAEVRTRIRVAARRAGRRPEDVALVVVTKTFPASDVHLLAALGATDVGESREPEASDKAAACAGLGLRWHQVGQVQTNKAAAVVAWADAVHSVDRPRLVDALSRAAQRAGRELGCFLQVSLDGDPSRGGARPGDVLALAERVAGAPGLRLEGVMAVAPQGPPPQQSLAVLVAVSEALRAEHPGAGAISAGMSGDLEVAVALGATHVRVGRGVLGSRAAVR
jgi:pyridoxal phosphate enzyme (YggS family)